MAAHDHGEEHDPFGLLEHVATSLGRHFYTYVFRPDGTFETVFEIGAAWESFLGGGVPEGVDDDAAWMAAVRPDDRELYESLDAPIRRGDPVDAQYRLNGFDGRVRWVEVHERARTTGDGRIIVDGVVSDITSRKETELALEAALRKADRIARVDGLTGAYNRRHVSEVLESELARGARAASRSGCSCSTSTTSSASTTRTATARRRGAARGHAPAAAARAQLDTVGRWGGEEFLVVAARHGRRRGGPRLRRRSPARLDPPRAVRALGDEPVVVTGSVGAARADDGEGADELVAAADRALYTAKRRGRDRVELASEIEDETGGGDDVEAMRVAQALARASSVREGVSPIHAEQVARLAGLIAEARRCRGADASDPARRLAARRRQGRPAGPDPDEGRPPRPDEWAVVRTHPVVGEELVRRIPPLGGAAPAVRHHHERWDGQGYPDGLAGEAIPLEARIVAAADTYCALTDDRIFRTSRSHDEAIRELERSAGTQLDPWVVAALIRTLERERGRIAQLLRGVA